MKKYSSLLISFCLIIISLNISDCKKKDGCGAGTGGNVTLKFYPQHHGIPITSSTNYHDSILIKYNATDFPGTNPSLYDKIAVGSTGDNFVIVPGMKCGQYYVSCAGFDTSAQWNIRVVGGIPLNFSETSGEKAVTIPVTE